MKRLFLLILLAVFGGASTAQPSRKCTSPAARAFDFWIGEWDIAQKILQRDGTWLDLDARTSVSPTLDGCALIEHWEGSVQFFWEGMQQPEPMRGLSVRSFDPESGRWYIHWMDTRNPHFGGPYVGDFSDDTGEFFREWDTPEGKRIGRITFSETSADSVDWELAVSSDEGATWSAIWKMQMTRSGR